jgi:hypothetical protein
VCGRYRGALHNSCNQLLKLTRDVTVIFHNLRRYDGHFIMQEIAAICENKKLKVECIAKGMEDYIMFKVRKPHAWAIRFIDSCQFLQASLDHLVNVLPKNAFIASKQFLPAEHFDLLARKGVFMYDYVDSLDKLEERNLPDIASFYSKLNESGISKKDYDHAVNVMELLKLQSIGEYSDLYLLRDVVLLADVFENFRKLCLQTHGLDPCHYCTSPGFCFDACLKLTKVELDLLQEQEMYEFFEKSIRGGIAVISGRFAEANNRYAPYFDPIQDEEYLLYLDGVFTF